MALKYMLLAMIEVLPRTGYELTKAFDQVLSNFWSADQRQVYHALDKLEADGWIAAERVVQENAPNKNVFSITPLGKEELERWLRTPQPPQPLRLEWMAQFFFGGLLEPQEIEPLIVARLARLLVRQSEMRGHIADYQRIFNSDNPNRVVSGRVFALRMMLFRYVLRQHEMERVWLAEMSALLEELKISTLAEDMAITRRLIQALLDDFPAARPENEEE